MERVVSHLSGVFKRRAEKAIGLLRGRGVEGLLLFPGVELFYLTGFSIGLSERPSAALIPFEGEPVLIVPELERELRGQRPWIREVETWREEEDPFDLIAENLRRRGLSRSKVGICETAPWGWVKRLEERLPTARFVDASEVVNSLRMVKEEGELDRIRRACGITDRAVEAGFQGLEEGMTELELASAIREEMRRLGGMPQFCLVLFGEKAALPHGRPGERRLRRGDVVLVDAGASVDGYFSDLTRTVVFGEATARQRRIWEVVLRANRAAFEAIRPGTTCEEADGAARRVIEEEGFGEFFIHRLGHGVGLQVHEHPYLVKGNRMPLRPGMTFTIEPGIYIVGEIGVRIEDTALCTPEGCESLTGMRRSLEP
ncbi:aminopeptidase P family protein [Candidatus Bathyarchaeota archaeon]|nr:MAG: aminopeptidase P family protein [Candidatus Bathyarchaeota archaeon]